MQAVILAGGKGTRISSISDLPKPLIPVDGISVIDRTIYQLKSYGINDIIITGGYKYEMLVEHFRNKHTADLRMFIEETPLGSAGALYHIADWITGDFLLINGDLIFDIDLNRFIAFHEAHTDGNSISICVHPNSHPYDSAIVVTENDRVKQWIKKDEERGWYQNLVNAGIHILPKSILEDIPYEKADLDTDVLIPHIDNMFAYRTPEYISDMGTPERYAKVEEDVKNGVVTMKNLKYKQKAIFLDRDGVINKYKGYIKNIDDFELIEGVADAITDFHKMGYLVIVVTNQPVIARGELTEDGLDEIHRKMETLLGQEGSYIDALYYCPHHPDGGFPGERPELKFDCECRKPKPGMLFDARDKFNIDIKQSWTIGDSKRDVEAGKNAGTNTILLEDGITLKDATEIVRKGQHVLSKSTN
ncbi:MAG: D-glycero-beta-D-manno-heptose 1,7-bisphosphate 7-phosphatase [Faecalicoccus sp.]|nr:D-glycero-beta-D-manno-heptose 1,7-bisphosphate 7-phosphatase [Faecalicoccus sp.]